MPGRRFRRRGLSRASRLVVRRQTRLRQISATQTVSRTIPWHRLRFHAASTFFLQTVGERGEVEWKMTVRSASLWLRLIPPNSLKIPVWTLFLIKTTHLLSDLIRRVGWRTVSIGHVMVPSIAFPFRLKGRSTFITEYWLVVIRWDRPNGMTKLRNYEW